jgi:hypothetical protein
MLKNSRNVIARSDFLRRGNPKAIDFFKNRDCGVYAKPAKARLLRVVRNEGEGPLAKTAKRIFQ